MRILILVIITFMYLLQNDAFAVGGISNTKVIVPSTETVPADSFELEPFFGAIFTDDSVDSRNYEAGLRFTKGLFGTFEAGFNVVFLTIADNDLTNADYEFGDISPGVKYRFYDTDLFSLAYQGGFTIPASSGHSDWVFEPGGVILTKNFTDRLSLDVDGVIGFDENDTVFVNSNAGLGYFVTDNFQPVVELNYLYENPDNGQSSDILSVTGGFTANLNSFTTLIIGFTCDVISENAVDSFTVTSALTLLF